MINHDTNCNHSTRQNPAAAGLLASLTTPTRSTISYQYLEPLESIHQERPLFPTIQSGRDTIMAPLFSVSRHSFLSLTGNCT